MNKTKLRDIPGYAERLARYNKLERQAPRGLTVAELAEMAELSAWLEQAEIDADLRAVTA